jgi:hypothetical protein
MWWRIFIPSWRFFDQAGAAPRLEVRYGDSTWLAVEFPVRSAWWNLFFNPQGTLAHARHMLYERLLVESQSATDVAELVSYRLTAQIAEGFVRNLGAGPGVAMQFKLRGRDGDLLIGSEAVLP